MWKSKQKWARPNLEENIEIGLWSTLKAIQEKAKHSAHQKLRGVSLHTQKGLPYRNLLNINTGKTKPTRPVDKFRRTGPTVDTNHDDVRQYLNTLRKTAVIRWIHWNMLDPYSQDPGDETQHITNPERLIREFIAIQKLEQLNPEANQQRLDWFLSHFDRTNSTLNSTARHGFGDLLVDFHDTFAWHRFEIGVHSDFE